MLVCAAGPWVMQVHSVLEGADRTESHCARHFEMISYQLKQLEFFPTSPS